MFFSNEEKSKILRAAKGPPTLLWLWQRLPLLTALKSSPRPRFPVGLFEVMRKRFATWLLLLIPVWRGSYVWWNPIHWRRPVITIGFDGKPPPAKATSTSWPVVDSKDFGVPAVPEGPEGPEVDSREFKPGAEPIKCVALHPPSLLQRRSRSAACIVVLMPISGSMTTIFRIESQRSCIPTESVSEALHLAVQCPILLICFCFSTPEPGGARRARK